jgi:hypothetical protein
MEFLILILPLAAGAVQAFTKTEAVFAFTEDFHGWLGRRCRAIQAGESLLHKIARFTLVPTYSLFMTINDLTANIADFGLRSGVRIASYLYLVTFLVIIVLTFGYKVFILAIFGLGLFLALVMLRRTLGGRRPAGRGVKRLSFVEGIWPSFRSDSARRRVARLLDVPSVEVEYTGDIFACADGAATGKTKVGTVDDTGKIYDTRRGSAELVGWVDDQGRVIGDRIIFNA